MKFSYSRVETFAQCPRRYKFQYLDRLKTLPDQSPTNALYLGNALHKGLETGDVERAIEDYTKQYSVLTDENVHEIIKLEYVIPKALEMLPDGECEVSITTPTFRGFIDRLCPTYVDENGVQHWDLYDYKYTTNGERYRTSKQLHIYKYYYELTHPNNVIDHLYYLIIKKVGIRQKFKSKPPETITQFRDRLKECLESSLIEIMEVEYDESSITQFLDMCKFIEQNTQYPKNESKLCDWCQYKEYCQSDGEIDYMIVGRN